MAQKYEIFYGDKVFVIADNSNSSAYDDYIVFPIEPEELVDVENYYKLLDEHPEKKGVVIMNNDPNPTLHQFISHFKEIKAAGGLVVNDKGNVLLMKRRGMWDLPKGKVEEGEFMRQAAMREVKEETGLKKVKIKSTIRPTFHLYDLNGELVLKTTYWYLMENKEEVELVPQTEEDIEEVKWVLLKELKPYLNQTYPNIKMILALFASEQMNYE
ncbi:MAG: NUDIX domain-containing protein [Bacteroidia bacterium]